MPKVSNPPARRYVVLFLIALLLVTADQLTKWWLRKFAIGQPLWSWGIFGIARVPPNTGAAFGLFPEHTLVLVIVSLVGIAFVMVYTFVVYRRYPLLDSWLSRVSVGMILGGTVGNLLDRCLYLLGRLDGVTDFIHIGWWPPFNVADSSVVVGVILFVISLFPLTQRHGPSAW